MNHDTEILIQPLKNGSVKAFDALYQLYSARLYNFVLKISKGDTYMAEEIVQRVFIKIWEERSLLDTQKSFNAFICTIAKNMLMNEYKHQMVEFVYQDYILQINEEGSSDGVDKIEYVFLEKYLNTLIEQLTPARREVYIMNRIDKLTVKEIAQRSGKSEKTIEKQLSEANEFIRRQFSKHYDKLFSLLIIPFLA